MKKNKLAISLIIISVLFGTLMLTFLKLAQEDVNVYVAGFLRFFFGLIIILLLLFKIDNIAKLASAFQLMMLGLICFAVIVMRESRIEAYDPGYKSPFYPWMQIFGVFSPIWLIAEMGIVSILFSLSLVTLGTIWYLVYGRARVIRSGAIYHLFVQVAICYLSYIHTYYKSFVIPDKSFVKLDKFQFVILVLYGK